MGDDCGGGGGGSSKQACRVYVGNLAWKASWQDLKDHLRDRGLNAVRVDVFIDNSGRSRGCGLVEFATPEEALECIDKVTDTELLGRQIFVREDKEENAERPRNGGNGGSSGPRRGGIGGGGHFRDGNNGNRRGYQDNRRNGPRSGGGRGGGGYHNQNNNASTPTDSPSTVEPALAEQIYVGNLAWRTTTKDLREHFSSVGDVVSAEVAERDGRSRGWGTVKFATPELASQAVVQLHDSELDGRVIIVRPDQGRKVFSN